MSPHDYARVAAHVLLDPTLGPVWNAIPEHQRTMLADIIVEAIDSVPSDVRRLVVAARVVAFEDDTSPEAIGELDDASEAFADRVPWDDEPFPLPVTPEKGDE